MPPPRPSADTPATVGDLAGPYLGGERDDLVSAIYEAERSLRTAERHIQRALKLATG